MNRALQKLLVMLALVAVPWLGYSQAAELLTFQNTEVTYDFTSQPNSPSMPGAFEPEHGEVSWVNNGSFEYTLTYTPNEGFIGTDNFRLVRWVTNPAPSFTYLDVTVTVAPALIDAYHDYATTYTNQPVMLDVLANDISSNGVKILQAVPAINHGSASFDSETGLINFTPAPGFRGTAHFNYALCNGIGDCDDGTVSITVMEETPTTEDETVEVFTKKNKTQFVLVPENYILVQAPANGVFDPGADVPEYTPTTDFVGDDSIVFTDGNHQLTFEIEVLDLADNAFAYDDRLFTTTNSPVVGDIEDLVTENDLPLTGCTISYSTPQNGTLDEVAGQLTYTPNPGFVGTDQFTYQTNLCGTGTVETATVTVFVSNFAPDRSTFEMATPKGVPIIVGYNVPVSTFNFDVTAPGELGTTVFLEGYRDTLINGYAIQGNNLLVYIPDANINDGLDEIEITYCLVEPGTEACLVEKQVKIWMTILDLGDDGEPVCVGDCVWAGDTNADGIVNMNDLLPIGLNMGEIGNERQGATFDQWYGQYADDWNSLFGSGITNLDVKHIDADGNSIVTAQDTAAIRSFYGRTHNMVPDVMPYAPYEFILEGPLFINEGDYVEFDISIGTAEQPVEDLYGFVFPFVYNPEAVDETSLNIQWDNDNFLAYDSPVIFMEHNDEVGKFDAGYTRTSGLVASGYGKLGKFGIVIDDLVGFRLDEEEIILNFGGNDGSGMDIFGNYSSIKVRPFQLRIRRGDIEENEPEFADQYLKTYPNPTGDLLTVHLNGNQEFEHVMLSSMTGQVVLNQTSKTNHTVLDLSNLPNGVYVLSVANGDGVLNRKIQVAR